MAMIDTIDGLVSEEELICKVERMSIPCGESVETSYYDKNNRLVKKDIAIVVTKIEETELTGKTGE